jgi:hypothetical protein
MKLDFVLHLLKVEVVRGTQKQCGVSHFKIISPLKSNFMYGIIYIKLLGIFHIATTISLKYC